MQTYFGSTLRAGSGTLTDTVDGGYVVMSQTVTATTVTGGTAVTSSVFLPASSQIIDLKVDVTVVAGGGTATTLPITVGTAAAGTQYMASTDGYAGGRMAFSPTTAQVLAMSDIGANQTVYLTIDPNGTVTVTQAVVRLTVTYAQKV